MPKIKKVYTPLYTSDKRYFILTGGRGCFYGDQRVITKDGPVDIKDVKVGDMVKSYNEKDKRFEYKEVLKTFEYDNNKIYNIRLKNGTVIKVTGNHKFYSNGEWVKIEDLLKTWYGGMEEDSKI